MTDELVDDFRHSLPQHPIQQELIQKYCDGIEARIRSATSRSEAEQLVESSCDRFSVECESVIVRSFLEQYVAVLFQTYWKEPS